MGQMNADERFRIADLRFEISEEKPNTEAAEAQSRRDAAVIEGVNKAI
jgi:hypothetical protein